MTYSDGSTITVMYPVTQYIWGPDRVLVKREVLTGNSYYYLYNGHGDVVQIVDTAGNIVNQYDYDVWGNFITKEETIENHFTYFGQTYDETTGLYYLRARYYDPTTGRFTQQDPAEDGYNWYVYGNNNSLRYVDPRGEAAETIFDIISFGVSAKEVLENPKDIWSWVALAGDAVDFIPFVAGVGESVKTVRIATKTVENSIDVAKLTTKEVTDIASRLGYKKQSIYLTVKLSIKKEINI